MRAFDLMFTSRYWLLSSILLVSAHCCAQAPDETQRCDGTTSPVSAHRLQPVSTDKGSPGAAVADATQHTIKLTWKESTSPASTVEGYYIYRRESGPKCESQPNQCELLNSGKPIKGTNCTDYAVIPGHTYFYEARTVGTNTLKSGYSNSATATAR